VKDLVIPEDVTSIGIGTFYGCSGLTSVIIPESVTSIGYNAFNGSHLKSVYMKGKVPPSMSVFGGAGIYNHTTLYVPVGAWDTYAFDDDWGNFVHIQELATATQDVSSRIAYSLVNTNNFSCATYEPVSGEVQMLPPTAWDESNANHNWQVVEVDGKKYLYNVGAKKYATVVDGDELSLTSTPVPITMTDSADGIMLGSVASRAWGLAGNDSFPADDEWATAISVPKTANTSNGNTAIYNLNGQQISTYHSGLNIIRSSDGKVKKVMVK